MRFLWPKLIMLVSVASGCSKSSRVFSMKSSGTQKYRDIPVSPIEGYCYGDIEPGKQYGVVINANGSCPPDEASLTIEPRSFTQSMRVGIGGGDSLASATNASGLVTGLSFISSGKAVSIKNSGGASSSYDMELVLPLPAEFGANSVAAQPVLIYEVTKSLASATAFVGLKTASEVQIEGNVAMVKVRDFGRYQIVIPSSHILANVEKTTDEIAATGVSSEVTTVVGSRVYWMNGTQTLSTMTSTPVSGLSHGSGWILPLNHAIVSTASGVPLLAGIRAHNFDGIP